MIHKNTITKEYIMKNLLKYYKYEKNYNKKYDISLQIINHGWDLYITLYKLNKTTEYYSIFKHKLMEIYNINNNNNNFSIIQQNNLKSLAHKYLIKIN